MRIFVAHRKKFRLFGPDRFEVVVCVHFSEIEGSIIATHGLQRLVVIERMPTVFKALDGECRERDNNIYLEKFLTDMHIEAVASQKYAKAFQHELVFALRNLRSYINLLAIESQNTCGNTHQRPKPFLAMVRNR